MIESWISPELEFTKLCLMKVAKEVILGFTLNLRWPGGSENRRVEGDIQRRLLGLR